MKYWEDDYLLQLQRKDPYKGLLNESGSKSELEIAKEAVEKLGKNNIILINYKSKTDDHIENILLWQNNQWNKYTRTTGVKHKIIGFGLSDTTAKPISLAESFKYFEVSDINKTSENLLLQGWKLDSKPMDNNSWKVLNIEISQKAQKASELSAVAGSLSDALNRAPGASWVAPSQ